MNALAHERLRKLWGRHGASSQLLTASLACFVVGAAEAETDAKPMEYVIVTAQKREERIQDVPFAITAIGQQEIRDRGSPDIKDLQYSIPGINIQELQPGANRITMRGINPGAGTGLPIVGVYVDEVGISVDQQQRDSAFPLVDIERVEVLRGPQGTLYGQGSIAGTIRYITRDPDLTRSDGRIETNVYSQEDGGTGYRVNGGVSIPLVTDRVGLRLSGGYDRTAGWIDYPAANIKDANEGERVFIRPKLLARLTDELTLTLLYQYIDQKVDTDAISGVGSASVRPGRTRLYPGQDESHLANAMLSWDFGPATLLSSTGFQYRELDFQTPIATFLGDFPSKYEQLSQEFRISSNGEGPLHYTAGVWYRRFLSHIDRILFLNGVPTNVARGRGDDPVDSESAAVFGDVTFSATDQLDLSLGARYYADERTFALTAPTVTKQEADFHSFSPRASAKYSWTKETSTYVTVSKGFRSGGFNASGSDFGPESLWNYEIGTKAALLGGALFVDIATYFVDYKDRQVQGLLETSPGVFLSETRAVGEASGFGVEGSLSAALGADLRLDLTAAYNDITSDVTNVEVVKGERFSFVPEFTGSVSLSQRFDIRDGSSAMWRLDYQYADPYLAISRRGLPNGTVETTQNFRTDPQTYLNARIGLERGPMGVYVDAQNILNEDTVLFPFTPITTTLEGTRARPRSYGLTMNWNF